MSEATRSNLQPVLDFLSRHAPFDQMQAEHLLELTRRSKLAFFAKGEYVTRPEGGIAQHLYIIKQGRVRGETESGEESVWELIGGESFPIGALLAHRPVNTRHRAMEDSFCFELAADDFYTLLDKSEVLRDFCTRRLANLLDQAQRETQSYSTFQIAGEATLNSPLGKLLRPDAPYCLHSDSIQHVLETLQQIHGRSIAIVDESMRPVGIITLRDVLERVTLPQRSLSDSVATVMSKQLYILQEQDFAFEAALLMAEQGIGHVCVVDSTGKYLGVVSERMLFSLQKVGLGNISRAIQQAASIELLKQLAHEIRHFTQQLMAQGASVDQLTRIIAALNDRLTQRVISLTVSESDSPPPPFTWLAFGSEGREEQTLKTDQDNGILFEANSKSEADALRQQLLPLALQINHRLAEVGFPLCPGNIMASNPICCLSLEEWQARFQTWLKQGDAGHLLNAAIFFDFRPLYGPTEPVLRLRQSLHEGTSKNPRFLHMMAANALRNTPPLGLFSDFRLKSKGGGPASLDLKLQALTPFVDAARIYALAHNIKTTNTQQRLRDAAKVGAIPLGEVSAWCEAYGFLQMLRMRQHQQQDERGDNLDNKLAPESLNELDRRILKEALRQARKLQQRLAMDYQL